MTYRELLELYKEGKLEEEKKQQVEADIEKQDAISEYLFQEADIPELTDLKPELSENADADESETEQKFLKMIRQSIRRAFVKMGVTVGAVVTAILLFVVFLLPNLVSAFYYDPGKVVAKGEYTQTNQMSLDMAVYTELFLPGYYRDNVVVDSRGYGNYDICIYQNVSVNRQFTNVSGKVEKGNLVLYDTNTLSRPAGNVFIGNTENSTYNDGMSGELMGASGTVKEFKTYLQELKDDEKYVAYITLDRPMDYETLRQWYDSLESNLGMLWYAVGTENEYGEYITWNLGFSQWESGSVLNYDEERYPYLRRLDENGDIPEDPESTMAHLISMLRYMDAQKEFQKMMMADDTDFAQIADDIEEQGISIYGIAGTADKETLLDLSEQEGVYYIHTEPLR